MSILKVILSAFLSVILLFLLTKIIGNKQMSELNMFDYINGISIGSIAAEMATGEFEDIWFPAVAMIVYTLVAVLFAILTNKSVLMRRIITGDSMVLYDKGKLYKKNFKKAKLDLSEFLAQCRVSGYFSLSDIESAFIEPNGKISILAKTSKNYCTPQQLNISVSDTRPEVNVIIDSTVLDKNLRYLGKDRKWLDTQLHNQKKQIEDIFLAVCDDNGNVTIYDKLTQKPKNDIFQ